MGEVNISDILIDIEMVFPETRRTTKEYLSYVLHQHQQVKQEEPIDLSVSDIGKPNRVGVGSCTVQVSNFCNFVIKTYISMPRRHSQLQFQVLTYHKKYLVYILQVVCGNNLVHWTQFTSFLLTIRA